MRPPRGTAATCAKRHFLSPLALLLMTPGFANRTDAAHQLAAHLQHLRQSPRGVVLVVPRGGVPMGAIVAKALDWPLDVVLTKKIGHLAHPEYAVGAVSLESVVLTPGVVLPDGYLDEQVARIRQRLQQRHQAYVGNRLPLVLTGRTVVLVDDGVATGHTLLATVELVRQQAPARVVVAVPVSSPQALGRLQAVADEVVCLLVPPNFQAVGQFYQDFTQVIDE